MPNPSNRFCEHLFLQKGLSKVTVKGYRNALRRIKRAIGEPEREKVMDYLQRMKRSDYSYSHISNTITVVSRYMEFIKQPIDIEQPKRPKTLPAKEILTIGEIARLLAATKNSREKAMMAILAYTGLRNKEVCNLKVRHLDLGGNLVKVFNGKGHKDRVVPMSQECAQIITRYLSDYPRQQEDYLFTTLGGNRKYRGWALRQRVKEVASRVDIDKRIYPHLFRHSFITHLIDGGANIVSVQQFAGHTRTETTLAYTHLSPKRMMREYIYFMPSYL